MANARWKPLPAGLRPAGALFTTANGLLLEVFLDAGVPCWIVSWTGSRAPRDLIHRGTADSLQAAKSAALHEAETAMENG
jgi:hypothetical protein